MSLLSLGKHLHHGKFYGKIYLFHIPDILSRNCLLLWPWSLFFFWRLRCRSCLPRCSLRLGREIWRRRLELLRCWSRFLWLLLLWLLILCYGSLFRCLLTSKNITHIPGINLLSVYTTPSCTSSTLASWFTLSTLTIALQTHLPKCPPPPNPIAYCSTTFTSSSS